MTLAAVLVASALTRAEIIERFKAPPATKVDGLVQVVADCPADMRREYQGPVAGFAADICRVLYGALREKPRRFNEPGIVIHIGEARTNIADIVVREAEHFSGERFTRIYVPAPAFADTDALRIAVARAFYRSVRNEEITGEEAARIVREADPRLKADFSYREIDRWLKGEKVEGDDREMMRLYRSVIVPGTARQSDVLRFAARLYLYPPTFDAPFCGRYFCASFDDALKWAKDDPRIRLAAFAKASEVVLFGGGRSEELYKAAEAYSEFLMELGRFSKSPEELLKLLDEADTKLNIAMETARLAEQGEQRK